MPCRQRSKCRATIDLCLLDPLSWSRKAALGAAQKMTGKINRSHRSNVALWAGIAGSGLYGFNTALAQAEQITRDGQQFERIDANSWRLANDGTPVVDTIAGGSTSLLPGQYVVVGDQLYVLPSVIQSLGLLGSLGNTALGGAGLGALAFFLGRDGEENSGPAITFDNNLRIERNGGSWHRPHASFSD